MKKAWLGVFAALTMIGSAACSSSSSDPAGTGKDTGTVGGDGSTVDTGKPGDTATGTDAPKTDAKKDVTPVEGGDGGPSTGEGTTGKACTADTDCDISGSTIQFCSNAGFTNGTLYPSPVCLGLGGCDPGDGTTIMYCDGEPDAPRGVCLSSGGKGLCLPLCTFDNTGAESKGCVGKDACNPYGWGSDPTTGVGGVGYCFGGCTADTDCTKGDKCQSGLCVKAPVTYSKTLGTACTDVDAKAPAKCDCLYGNTSKKGYCTQYCRIGDAATACPSGFTCSSGIPTTATDGSALFSKEPANMAASCLKSCATDADCTALSTTCVATPAGKVCYFAG